MSAGERFVDETDVTGCIFLSKTGAMRGCPFLEVDLRRKSFCGWYNKEVEDSNQRPEFCEVVLVRVEGIRK